MKKPSDYPDSEKLTNGQEHFLVDELSPELQRKVELIQAMALLHE